MLYTSYEVTVILEYIVTQLLTATAAAEGESSKQSLLRGHNDKVSVHHLRAVGLISSGVCESVVSYYPLATMLVGTHL